MRLFKALLVTGLLTAYAIMPPPGAEAGTHRLQPRAHELRLDGLVHSVDVARRRVIIDVESYTLPNGWSRPLERFTAKLILVGRRASLHRRGEMDVALNLRDVKPGLMVVCIGRDLGQGRPLPLREMIVWTKAAPVPPPPPPASIEPDA